MTGASVTVSSTVGSSIASAGLACKPRRTGRAKLAREVERGVTLLNEQTPAFAARRIHESVVSGFQWCSVSRTHFGIAGKNTSTPKRLSKALCRLALLVLCIGVVSGCDGIKSANDTTARLSKLTGDQRDRLRAAGRGKVHVVDRPYYGEAVVVAQGTQSGTPLPTALEGARSINIDTRGSAVGIKALATLIKKQTDLPVNIRRVYSLANGDVIQIPIGSKMVLKHEGALSKVLDKIAARMDLAWRFDGTAITFDRMVTKRYSLSLPIGTTSLQTSIAGVKGGGSSASLSRSIGGYDPWKDLETQLMAVAPPPAKVTLSQSAGRVSIFGPPSVQRKAAGVIEDFEAIFSTRIALEVAIYFIDADKSDEFAVGLDVTGSDGSFTRALGALTGSGVATLQSGGGSISFQALAQEGSVVDYRLGSTIAQSGVVAPIVLTRSQSYIGGTTTKTTDNGDKETEIKAAVVDTGISIHALPRLVGKDKIQLSLTLLQNNLVKLETFTTGNETVQLPTVDQRVIQNDSVLAPGETLVLSGYEQESATRANKGTGLARFIGLGGSAKGKTRKIRMVVLVRPAILPAVRNAGRGTTVRTARRRVN